MLLDYIRERLDFSLSTGSERTLYLFRLSFSLAHVDTPMLSIHAKVHLKVMQTLGDYEYVDCGVIANCWNLRTLPWYLNVRCHLKMSL